VNWRATDSVFYPRRGQNFGPNEFGTLADQDIAISRNHAHLQMYIMIIAYILLLVSSSTFAAETIIGYPYARANHDLRKEISDDGDRFIPSYEKATFAVDGDIWQRTMGTQEFYHGFGYWLQPRAEIRPNSFFVVNVRGIAYSGSSSEGYANPFGIYALIGTTGIWPEQILSARLLIRAGDIERQTVGAGLLIQDREMNGGLLSLSNDYYEFRVRADSTGALVRGDDTLITDLSLFGGWFSSGAALWTASKAQSHLPENRAAYFYVGSSHAIYGNLKYELEGGRRAAANAGLANLSYANTIGGLRLNTKVEYRIYNHEFGKDFVGQIQNQYVSYDQLDKPFTNAMNVFVRDDNAQVYALHLDAQYSINHKWRMTSLNEIGQFDYRNAEDKYFYFYRVGASHCPLLERDDCVTLFFSNKVLNDSYNRPPKDVSLNNVELFKSVQYVGVEGHFRF
jgi:hypothetical protein